MFKKYLKIRLFLILKVKSSFLYFLKNSPYCRYFSISHTFHTFLYFDFLTFEKPKILELQGNFVTKLQIKAETFLSQKVRTLFWNNLRTQNHIPAKSHQFAHFGIAISAKQNFRQWFFLYSGFRAIVKNTKFWHYREDAPYLQVA